ncbi:MAG: hypothetical protein IT322_20780 [Anaerolineae bacterium]|nr:hypothetical protein [Anaerolineae bacterium]
MSKKDHMPPPTAVSFRGDAVYKKALKAVAAQKGITVADLVRQAVDKCFEDEIRPHLEFFAANTGRK